MVPNHTWYIYLCIDILSTDRQIEMEETQELQKVWLELCQIIKAIYRDTRQQRGEDEQTSEASKAEESEKVNELVHRCVNGSVDYVFG